MSSVYHLQTVGEMEVVNRSLEMYLHYFCSIWLADWHKLISGAQYSYITSWHNTIKMTLFYAIFGRVCILIIICLINRYTVLRELQFQMRGSQEQMKLYNDNGRQEVEFKIGDSIYVMLQSRRQICWLVEWKLNWHLAMLVCILLFVASVRWRTRSN